MKLKMMPIVVVLAGLSIATPRAGAQESDELSVFKASYGDESSTSLADPLATPRAGAQESDELSVFKASYGDESSTSLADPLVVGTVNLSDVEIALSDAGCATCAEPACDKGCGCTSGLPRLASLSRAYSSFEFLHWYSKDRRYPALVTTSPPGTPLNVAETPISGALGQAGTSVLFGNDDIGGDRQSGGRVTLGLWLDDCRDRAVGIRFYANEGEDEAFAAASNGAPHLHRPFFNTNPAVNQEDTFIVAYPGTSAGSINMSASTDVIGAEIFGRTLFDEGCGYRLDLMAGYRFNRIDDGLFMASTSNPPVAGVTLVDIFDSQNEYHAGELGLITDIYRGCWTISLMGKIGLGNMHQQFTINGLYNVPGGPNGAGGLMAQPTNINVYRRDVAVWSPEANIKLTYDVNDRLGVSVGYTFLYWSRVALAGDNIDRNVNGTQITSGVLAGPPDPRFAFNDTDYWVQTIDIGFSFNY
jgi:hypothetical protein